MQPLGDRMGRGPQGGEIVALQKLDAFVRAKALAGDGFVEDEVNL
jgi:hypothetical protein